MEVHTLTEENTKTCKKCGERKAFEEFNSSPWTEDGRLKTCRLCASAAMKEGQSRRRAAATSQQPATTEPVAVASGTLSKADWDKMFMLIVYGGNGYIKSMEQCYSQNAAAFKVERVKILEACERLWALLPPKPVDGAEIPVGTGKSKIMSGWIRVGERLPEVGERIWARFSKKNGEARKVNPVVEGDFDKSKYDDSGVVFIFGVHRNIFFPVDDCLKSGLTHWQPRLDTTPPLPQLSTTPDVSPPKGEKQKRGYRLTPDGRAALQEKMREYWRKKKGNAKTNGE
jgi:hypothetical protein